MPGSARSIVATFFSGLRVASTDYYPAHNKNGNNISQRLVINAFANVPRRGGDSVSEVYTLTAWGKLADICAKSMSKGKEFNVLAEPHAYEGRIFENDQPLARADGSLITTRKYSWTIIRLTFGEESFKTINDEIQANVRPADWNVPNSQGALTWKTILQQRMALQFDPAKPKFGYANVRLVTGAGIGPYVANQPANGAVPSTAQVASSVYNAAVQPQATVPAQGTVAPQTVPVQTAAPVAQGQALFGV